MDDARPRATEPIVVVDDDSSVCTVLTRFLTRHGYDATAYESAELALAHLRDPAVRCSLLLSDLTMGEMDGLALIRAARDLRPELTCLLLTGLGTNVPPSAWRDAGAAGLVAKPIRAEEFLGTVRAALDGVPG